jgi:hypothetical protein
LIQEKVENAQKRAKDAEDALGRLKKVTNKYQLNENNLI